MLPSFSESRVSLYQSGRIRDQRWRNAATVLLSAIIEDASRRGLVEVDFLRGDEGYKWGFASDAREIYRLRAANGVVAELAVNVLVLVARARSQLGRLARSAYGTATQAWQRRRRHSGPPGHSG